MHGFIENVVLDLIRKKYPISDYTFILPNKRSGLFLKREISKASNKTIFSPIIYDIDEFMSLISGVEKVSDTELLFDFYKVYEETTNVDNKESFEEFISWGKTLIKDFNEIDRELCDTKSLFDYLEALKDLNHWSNYEKETELIKNYKSFWKKIKIYHKVLKDILLKKRKGYQGLIYKIASQEIQHYVENQKHKKHVFIGFNALSKSECEVIQEILENKLGEIYWDIDHKHVKSEYNNANFFIDSYLKNWTYHKNNKAHIISKEYSDKKSISVIGTPKNIGQVKYAGEIISKMDNSQINNTAVILSDEKLLIPMINSLPKNVADVNVTMGFPYKYSSSSSLFSLLLQIHSKKQKTFYYKNVFSILSHELIKPVMNKDIDICMLIKRDNMVYISKDDLIGLDEKNSDLYDIIFSKWINAEHGILSCLNLIEILKNYYSKNQLSDDMNIELLHSSYKIFNQILLFKDQYKSIKSIKSLKAMYKEIVEMNTIPFNGKPIKGLQIMGMLETRLLDYENVIITSLNEGILPAGNSMNSFIPFEIKKTHDLQTYKEKDAVFAYHFYRIIKRAKNIWLTYNTEPDAMNTGEISRFIRQMEVEKIHELKKFTLSPMTPKISRKEESYYKTKLVREKIADLFEKGITASMLVSYVIDKTKFFENYIIGMREDDVEETIAHNTLGNVIHDSLEKLYKPLENKIITIKDLNEISKKIEKTVTNCFEDYINKKNLIKGKNIIIVETAKKYVERVIELDKREVKLEKKIKIISIEEKFENLITKDKIKYKIKGIIDRIDEVDGVIRIIDYKTGKKLYRNNLRLKSIEDIREENGIYNLQLMFYQLGIMNKYKGKEIETGIISIKNMKDGVLKGEIENNKRFDDKSIGQIKNEIIVVIEDILNENKLFKN